MYSDYVRDAFTRMIIGGVLLAMYPTINILGNSFPCPADESVEFESGRKIMKTIDDAWTSRTAKLEHNKSNFGLRVAAAYIL